MEIGNKIKRLRLQLNLSQAELAARCELTKGYISQLENDLTSPSISALCDILSALGTDLAEFFKREDDERIVFSTDDFIEKHEDDLVVTFILGGDDIPMQFVLNVDSDRQLIRLLSPIPVTFEGDKRIEGAIATCQANYRIADGSFDFDFKQGRILFRMTSSYIDSLISKDVFEYMVAVASYTVDEYNDKFFMLAKGQLPIEEFFKKK